MSGPGTIRECEKHTRDLCYICNCAVEKGRDGYFAPFGVSVRRGGYEVVELQQVCERDFHIHEAVIEAKANGSRFVEIGVGTDGKCYTFNGDRCVCGAVTLAAKGWCVLCWRESRMIEKKLSQARFNLKLIQTLKREIQDGNKKRRDAGNPAGSHRAGEKQEDRAGRGQGDRGTGRPGEPVDTGRTERAASGGRSGQARTGQPAARGRVAAAADVGVLAQPAGAVR